MVTRIQQQRGAAAGVLDYNENKVEKGVAWPIECVGMNNDPYSIYRTFEILESNPAISIRAKNFVFHMTVNPGPDDAIDEEGVKRYVADVMERLGYGGQPYVVYRHNDIDREHYHVVSSRVDASGRFVTDSFERLKLQAIQRELAPVYGFTVGLQDIDESRELPPPARLTPGVDNVLARIRSNVEEALRFNCRNAAELKAVLAAYGIQLKYGTRNGNGYYSFRGVGPDGQPVCRAIGLKRTMGLTVEQFSERIGETVRRGAKVPKGRICETVRKAFAKSTGLEDMAVRLAARGIVMLAMSPAGKMPSRADRAADFFFIDMRTREVASLSDTGITLAEMQEMARSAGAKKKPETKKKKKTAAVKVRPATMIRK